MGRFLTLAHKCSPFFQGLVRVPQLLAIKFRLLRRLKTAGFNSFLSLQQCLLNLDPYTTQSKSTLSKRPCL